MCGRYTQHHDTAQVAERFGAGETLFDSGPRYNVAPTQTVPVVVARESTSAPDAGVRVVDGFDWGLVPFWAKDASIGSKMINARSETVAEKPAFKHAFTRRRCILPSDGFYEWDKAGGTKQPYHFRRRDGELFGFAGLWERWKKEDGSELYTCTILTTEANQTVGPIHDRMPVILRTPEDENLWLDAETHDSEMLLSLLRPYPEEWMEAVPVSKRVNRPVVDEPELLATVNSQ